MANNNNGKNPGVSVITGASSGIGAQFARALALRGHDLVLVARRRERLEALARELSAKYAVDARVLLADLSSEKEVETVAQRISAEERLELLVNNAGFGTLGSFSDSSIVPQMDMHRVHVLAALRLTHAAVTALLPRDRGGVINVSSVSAFLPGHASYSSTKTWMNTFTECLHLELKSLGSHVRVQALCPGYTYTEFHDLLGIERDRIMPNRHYWLTPEFVVAESLKAFDEDRWLVIPSWRYRLIVFFLRILPRPVLHQICLRVAARRESARKT